MGDVDARLAALVEQMNAGNVECLLIHDLNPVFSLPGSLGFAELRDTLAAIAAHTNVIGFDFVEVNPQLDVGTGTTAYLGAHTVVEFLGQICDQPQWIARREAKAG